MLIKLPNCPDCGAEPGKVHKDNCDVERCSVCGMQKIQCDHEGHDKAFARWTGFWPGSVEAAYLTIDLNNFMHDYAHTFFIKPEK